MSNEVDSGNKSKMGLWLAGLGIVAFAIFAFFMVKNVMDTQGTSRVEKLYPDTVENIKTVSDDSVVDFFVVLEDETVVYVPDLYEDSKDAHVVVTPEETELVELYNATLADARGEVEPEEVEEGTEVAEEEATEVEETEVEEEAVEEAVEEESNSKNLDAFPEITSSN